MSDTMTPPASPASSDVPLRRRPPPTPQELAARVRHADPCNGVVKVVAIGGETGVCYIPVRQALFGGGDFVDEIGCYDTLEAAEAAALDYARAELCLFAPAWIFNARTEKRER